VDWFPLPRLRLLTLLAALFAARLSGQAGAAWRFWDASDGFVESYTSSAALSPEGAIWLKHGSAGPVERLDGYFAPRFTDPKKLGALTAAPGGAVWMWGGDELMRFFRGKWSGWKIDEISSFGPEHTIFNLTWEAEASASPGLRGSISVIGLDPSHALILAPDRVLSFDAGSGTARRVLSLKQSGLSAFVALARGLDGSALVSGRGGWGRLTPSGGEWSFQRLPQPPAKFVEFDFPLEMRGENLFLTGVTGSHIAEALSFDGTIWKELYRGAGRMVRGFPGVDGTVWIQDGNNLVELAGRQSRPAAKTGVLSGLVLNLAPESAGRFWVGTSQGLARAAPSLWRTPPDSPPIDDVVNSIAEDRRGNVWFLEAHSLIRFDNSKWKSWPLPKGETAWAIFANGLQALPDGRMVVRVTDSHLLVFDPDREAFATVPYPASQVIRMITRGPDGLVLAEAIDPAAGTDSLDLFDGASFRPFASPEQLGGNNEFRSVEVTPEGDIYLGGLTSFGLWHPSVGRRRQGVFRSFGSSDGFADPGAFSVHRSPDGRIFAGGRDGVFELRNSKWLRLQSGLDRARQIVTASDGTVWVASGTGVHRWRNGVWLPNGEEEGLPSSVAYSVFEDGRGRIWAGTTRGLSLFHPEADPDPPIARFEADMNPREAPPGGKIRLTFNGLDKWKFTPESRLLFSWRLDNGDWSSFAPRNSVSFDQLGDGPHRVELRAMDRNGNVSPDMAVHSFAVLVPWYNTGGFRLIAGASLLLIGFFFTVAMMSYRHRGRLIDTLNQRNRLERQRQKILQMIAGREPSAEILDAIARAVSESCLGASCLLAVERNGEREIHHWPALPDEVVLRLRSSAPSPRNLEEWRFFLRSAVGRHFAQDLLAVPLGPDPASMLALLFHGPVEIGPSTEWILETFANLAAGALENSRLYCELAYQARHDALTGLPNRASFEQELAEMVGSADLFDQFAVLYLDLDRFKEVNDTLGHRVGDLLLRQVAVRLSGALKSAGKLFRIGGDEFIVLAPAAGGRDAIESLAASLLRSLDAPILTGGNELFASASIGVSFFPEDGDTSSILQKNADIAMYRAKAKGRNGFELFTAEMTFTAGAARNLEQILRHAVAEGRFLLRYQPQFTPVGGVAGFEAILQLMHPARGPVDAQEFLPVAEESGLIVSIGKWVVREACRQIAEWKSQGLGETRVSINISSQEIVRPSYASDLESILTEARIPGRALQIELTESELVANPSECAHQMQRLRALGVRLVLDDFGTGYSSLASLQNLPVDALKIDFLPPLLNAVAAAAESLGLALTVDHIETAEHLAAAMAVLNKESGMMQGNLLSPPVSASEAGAFLSGFAYLRDSSSVSMASEQSEALTS